MIEQVFNIMGYAVLFSAMFFTVTAEVYATVLVIKAIKKMAGEIK